MLQGHCNGCEVRQDLEMPSSTAKLIRKHEPPYGIGQPLVNDVNAASCTGA